MSDLAIRTLPDEKAKNLARALKARAPALHCKICGHRDFGMIEDVAAGSRTHLRREICGGDPSQIFTQKLITLICTNCGHLEQFAEVVLDGRAAPEQYGQDIADAQ